MSTLTFLFASIYSFILPLKNTTIEKHSFRSNIEQDRNNYSKINYSTIDLNVKLPQSLGKQVATVIDTTGEIVIGAKHALIVSPQAIEPITNWKVESEVISVIPTRSYSALRCFTNDCFSYMNQNYFLGSIKMYVINTSPIDTDEKYKILHGIPAQFEKFEDVY